MADSSIPFSIQTVRPRETRQALGQWIRRTRQRLGLTQPLLASKSGVSVTTLSRLEREGQGAVDHLLRALQALGELDGFHAHIQELLRKESLPRDLSEIKKPALPRQRVRLRQLPKFPS
ncbi:MAG: helix-turn-helix domain-containing protein [Verrucomicrobiia bacterium]